MPRTYLRLGSEERRLLLMAASADSNVMDGWVHLVAPGFMADLEPTRWAVIREARRTLATKGFIEWRKFERITDPEALRAFGKTRKHAWMQPSLIRITPLGARVVEVFRDELEHGKPIRWGRAPPDLLRALPATRRVVVRGSDPRLD